MIDTCMQVGGVTFAGKQNYINGVLYAPSIEDIETIKVMPAGCSNVLWYWKMNIGSKQVPVQGFNLFEVDGDNKITDMFVEFNSIAWGLDIGESLAPDIRRLLTSQQVTQPPTPAAKSCPRHKLAEIPRSSYWVLSRVLTLCRC